jgi:hypothetical protein
MGNALKMIMLANGDNRRSNEPMQDRREEYRGDEVRRSEYRGEDRTRSEYRGEGLRRSEDMPQRTDYNRQYPRSEDMRRYRDSETGTYSARNEDMPEMRRRRDKRGRYMGDDGEEMRMGLYDGGGIGYQTESRRDETYERRGAIHDQPQGKKIHATGSVWMDDEDDAVDTGMLMEWVQDMKDPKGKHIEPWSADEIKPLARRFGYPTTGEEFSDFYTAVHMMKSDYCAVAEEFDVDTPAYYAALADAWLKDPDAKLKGRKKLEAYYRCIVMGK